MENKRSLKSKGTLIALVITIIILLILSGVIIVILKRDNWLFSRVKQEYSINQAKEQLSMKIMAFKTSIKDNETLEQFEKFLLDDIEKNVYNVKKIYDNDDVDSELESMYVTEVKSGYTFLVDKNLSLSSVENIHNTEAVYEVESIEGDKYHIKINISNFGGIQKIQDINNNIISCYNKTKVGLDCKVEKNKQYQIKVYNRNNNEEIFILDTSKVDAITIEETDSYVYPIITNSGINVGKTLNIKWPEGGKNYYSLDEGKTWTEYSESLKIFKEENIKVKSIARNNEISQIISKKISLGLASDALGEQAYDNDSSTYFAIINSSKYMQVDKSAFGKKICFSISPDNLAYGMQATIRFLNENDVIVGDVYTTVYSNNFNILIPEGASKFEIYVEHYYYVNNMTIE